MTQDRPAVVERLAARAEALAVALGATGECDAPPELAGVDPCLALPCPAPSEEGARAFVDGVLAWLRDGTLAGIAGWLALEERGGLLPFTLRLWEELPRQAEETAPGETGAEDAAWVRGRLDELLPILSLIADAHMTRAHECVPICSEHLEALHKIASPLSVAIIALDWATGALESGDCEEAARRVASAISACQSMASIRSNVAERTPIWVHTLRRTLAARAEAPA